MLEGQGFKNVFNMNGGINAWDGLIAKGAPEAGIAYFPPAAGPEKLIALAWRLEDGTRNFYLELHSSAELKADGFFFELAKAEEHHKDLLVDLLKESSGNKSLDGFPGSGIEPEEAIMEGGIRVSEALDWAKGRQASDVVELALSLESNAFDLYIKMERRLQDEGSSKVFLALSREEKQHLERLEALYEKLIGMKGA